MMYHGKVMIVREVEVGMNRCHTHQMNINIPIFTSGICERNWNIQI